MIRKMIERKIASDIVKSDHDELYTFIVFVIFIIILVIVTK